MKALVISTFITNWQGILLKYVVCIRGMDLYGWVLLAMAFIAYNWIAWLCLIRLKKVTLPVFMRIAMESCGLEVGKMDFTISVLMAVFVILSTTPIIRIVYRPIL